MAKKLSRKPKATKAQLGAGVDALFGGGSRKAVDQALADNPAEVVKELSKKFATIPLNQIERNPDQPRYEFDPKALEELSESIKVHGIIQPLTVRYMEPRRYQIISGERRFRASKLAGLTEVPAYIRVANDQTLLEMALIENIQREDLNPLEIANSHYRLKQECELTDDQLAERIGKGRSTITGFLNILNLHPSVQEAVKQNQISVGHAKTFLGIDMLLQEEFLKELISKNWTVRQTEAKAKAYKAPKKKAPKPKKEEPQNNLAVEHERILQDFKAFFGTGGVKIQVEDKESGKGQIVLPFANHDQLTDLFKCIEQ